MSNHLSPSLSRRYGGSFENRTRLLREIVDAIHTEFPQKSLWVRVSATDFAEKAGKGESWTLEETKKLATVLAKTGAVDVIDCSAGGLVSFQQISPGPGYQRHLAAGVSKLGIPKSELAVMSVGMLEGATPEQPGSLAEEILQSGDADLVALARGFLGNPAWTTFAGAHLMGVKPAGSPHRPSRHRRAKVRSRRGGRRPTSRRQ